MKKVFMICLLLFWLIASKSYAQYFPVDTAKLNTAYRELVKYPNTLKCQKAFLNAFPNTWTEFNLTYLYSANKKYDLTMYSLAHKHVDILEKITLVPDSVYCSKLVGIAVGAELDADAPNYFQTLLHNVLWKRTDGMMKEISRLRRGHQMQFWQFYWSTILTEKRLEDEYRRFLALNAATYPKEMKIMSIAFEYFYDGVNFSGGSVEDPDLISFYK